MERYTRQECIDIAAGYQRDIDRLIEQYGRGCRPGWVSTDIALADAQISYWKRQADLAEDAA
ncbi:hypothetical protein [Actibacterium sp. MT2.3-13A]|uniref:hypothetical protein n=1 Tax=Actibacterium sp. MT2.3-13A TaxID=2828332 RepID=UPI001BAE2603|nr:hypothetical protein [Actibacterium sp. MT2.3-13A]